MPTRRSSRRCSAAVLAHEALRGNVETELADPNADADAGCGCAYPDWVGDGVVERSNRILARLRTAADAGQRAALAALPMWQRADVGPLAAGHRARRRHLAGGLGLRAGAPARGGPPRRGRALAGPRGRGRLRLHPHLPAGVPGGAGVAGRHARWILNNGAAGMPNFRGDAAGLLTRIAVEPSAHAHMDLEQGNGGRFASINRPIAGATHDKELPVGRHPLQLYSLATPNGVKVTVMLEELLALGHAGAEYDAWLIRIHEGDQFGSGFVAPTPTPRSRRWWTAAGRRRCACSSRARSCCTWPRSSARSCRRAGARAPSACRGCSGRWAARPTSAAASATSTPTRRPRSSTPSTATRWRSSASSTCSTAAWPRTPYLAGASTRSPTSPLALVRRAGARASSTARASSCRCRTTSTCSAGPTRSPRPAVQRGRMVNRTWGPPETPAARAPRRQ
jgi:hypothetical protein